MTRPGPEVKCHDDPDYLPCFSGAFCYHVNETCDGLTQCQSDWADEQNCKSTLLTVSNYLYAGHLAFDLWSSSWNTHFPKNFSKKCYLYDSFNQNFIMIHFSEDFARHVDGILFLWL